MMATLQASLNNIPYEGQMSKQVQNISYLQCKDSSFDNLVVSYWSTPRSLGNFSRNVTLWDFCLPA